MKSLAERIAHLSPERRALLELKLNQKSGLSRTAGTEQTVTKRRDAGPAPLSFAQQRLWFLNQLEPDTFLYNIPSAVRLEGGINLEALNKALHTIVARHAVLRTTIATSNGAQFQVVNEMRPVNLAMIDLSKGRETEREAELREVLNAEARKPFDLARDLMMRATLIKLDPASHVLLLVTHHIASDGWSIEVLFEELGALYEAFSKGKPNPLPELAIQYTDYTVWQRQWLQGELLDTQLSYWKQRLSGMSPLELPTDRPRIAARTYRGAVQSLAFSPTLTNQLKAISRDEGVTLFMTLLAAFHTLLHRYSGQHDIAVGSPIAGRTCPEIEKLIGFFVNTLVLRSDLSGNPTFLELVGRAREVCLGAYAHQDLPFEKLVEELRPERNLSNSPLFQVMFAHENLPTENIALPGIAATPLQIQAGTAMFDLTLTTREESERLTASLEYSTELFDDATIARMSKHFETLLEGIVAGPNRRLSELPLLTDTERQELLVQWNDTKSDYPKDRCIHELFEAQVERTPDVVAVVFEGRQLTYRELNSRANQLAHHLIKLGVGPDVPVTLSVERSLEMLVGVLGILKAGAAYVPLDPAYPPERLVFMVEDIRAPVLLTEQRFAASLATQHAATISLDTDWEIVAAESTENPASQVKPVNSACVIYTSGSTGKPKGVEVTHGGLVNYVVHAADVCGLAPADRVLQFSSISFDTAAEEIFCSLTRGATLVLRNDTMLSSVSDFLQACAKWGITVLDLPTAYWHEITARLFSGGLAMPDEIRLVIIGGERAIPERLTQWQACIGNRIRLWNSYGPTETTIAATLCELTSGIEGEKSFGEVSIGGPIPNVQLYVSDQDLNPVPAGVAGELLIGGAGVARGYLKRPELTAEQFIPDPFSKDPASRLYRTGDLVRYRRDGNLEFVGRVDHQVKIRGLRIETDEIETVLRQLPAVWETVVIAREDVPGDKRLVAYVVPSREATPNAGELRSLLNTKLPHYMVPSAFVFLAALPLTPNGKIDRKALPMPDQNRPELEESYAAPCTQVEEALARIWADVLKLERVGVHDNFFDIGGHSLLAVRVITEIEKTLGKKLRLSALFQAPTVKQLANLLGREVRAESWSSLMALQPNGSKPPFFWIHGEASDAFLPRYLGPDQPVYGIMHQGLDGTRLRYTKVETIAAHYLSEIRSVQPHGPYFLGGYCFGGLVGFEIAHQLRQENEEVGLLVVLDPVDLNDCKSTTAGGPPESTKSLAGRASRHTRALRSMGAKEKVDYLFERLTAKLRSTPAMIRNAAKKSACRLYLSVGRRIHPSLRSFYILGVYEQAMEDYLPRKQPGELIVFNCAKGINEPQNWATLAAGFKMHTAPGDHHQILREPNARVWAEQLKICLERAQTATQTK